MLPSAMTPGPMSLDELRLLRMHSQFARKVGHAHVPPRRSYLWRLLERCFGRRVAIVNVTLAGVEEIERVDQISPALNHCRFEAATIVAAHVFTAAAVADPAKQVRAELAGIVYGADAITELVKLATPIAAGEFVALGFELPTGWFVPPKQLPRS